MGAVGFGRRLAVVGLSGVLFLGAAACGDDDDGDDDAAEETTTTEAPADGDPAAFCDAEAELSMAFSQEEPPDEAEVSALFEQFEESAPEDLADEAQVMLTTARGVVAGDSDPDAFGEPEFLEAVTAVDGFIFETCEDIEKGEITAVDYAFEGVPAELPTGRHVIKATNNGTEIHEAILFRKDDGVDQPIAEILALGEEEGQELITSVGAGFMGPTGGVTYVYADLEPGSYGMVCFLPVGATDFEALESLGEEAPPHFTRGMATDFTVS